MDILSYEELLAFCKTTDWKAGPSNVFDALGAEIISRSRIPLLVVDGRSLDTLRAAIMGDHATGTIVCEEE